MNRYSALLRCAATAGGSGGSRDATTAATTITVKPLFEACGTPEPTAALPWPPPGENVVPSDAAALSPPRRPRSPFAVLRSQQTVVGRCTAVLRPEAPAPLPSSAPTNASTSHDALSRASTLPLPELCACAALMYTHHATAAGAEAADVCAVRDRFLMALKLNPSSETRLRVCVTEAELDALLARLSALAPSTPSASSPDMGSARMVTLCNEPPAAQAWCARLLLPVEEGSRVRWLGEESANFVGSFHRAPSLRSLAVMVSIQRNAVRQAHRQHNGHHHHAYTSTTAASTATNGASSSTGSLHGAATAGTHAADRSTARDGRYVSPTLPSPTLDDVLQVERRMEDRGEPWTMVDLAALALVAGDDPDVAAHLLRRCTEMLMPTTVVTTGTGTGFDKDNHMGGPNGNTDSRRANSQDASRTNNTNSSNSNGHPHGQTPSSASPTDDRTAAAAQLERDLGQIVAALVLWQQAMHFLDTTMLPPTAFGAPDTTSRLSSETSTAWSDATYYGNSQTTTHTIGQDESSPSNASPRRAATATTQMVSPSAILRERQGLASHFPVAALLDASSNLLRLHRAYLQSVAAQAGGGGSGGAGGRQGQSGGAASGVEDNAAHSLWRSASETARGLFTFGAEESDERRPSGTGPGSASSAAASAAAGRGDGLPAEPLLPLPEDSTLRSILFQVLHRLYRDVHRLAEETSGTIDNDEYLTAVTGWLLMEAPESLVCARHFRRLVESDPTTALKSLERSGLLGRQSPHAPLNLHVIVSRLLPLLQHCENEDFYNTAVREVLSVMEDQLRHDPYAFTSEDMKELAVMGTEIFAVSASEASHSTNFDASVRGQMEELHVMDGSPWALVVSSYTALREMVGGLHKDQQKLKQQVHEQMRSMGLMPSATTPGGAATAPPLASRSAAAAAATGGDAEDAPTRSSAAPTTASPASSPVVGAAARMGPAPLRLTASPALRHRFLVFLEDLVKDLVDDTRGVEAERPIVISSELFDFINRQVPVPNIQDEYRRKIFLLVNVAENPETTRQREQAREEEERRAAEEARLKRRRSPLLARLMDRQEARQKNKAAKKGPKDSEDAHGGVDEIPAELRFLVSSLPLTLSPWASVMILREVLAESAGKNPRYSYVLKAAIDLQLPISTTRSRIATTLNMWRFLTSQSHKLSLKENLVVKQRCVWNLPLSYILSSYWSLLTSFIVAFLVILNVVGIDFESQLVANTLFQQFAPFEELDCIDADDWHKEAATDLASDYLEQGELARKKREQRSSTTVILSSASYLFLGYDDQRRPFTLVPISSDGSQANTIQAADARHAEEYAGAASVLRELSLHVPFPFYMDFERPLPLELLEARVAERIRRISFNNTWFGPRMIIRTFPLGRQYTEHSLIAHTCAQGNLTRRRITFLFYIQDGVPVTETFLKRLMESQLAQSANLVLVVHERSLRSGGVSVSDTERLMNLPPQPLPPQPTSPSSSKSPTPRSSERPGEPAKTSAPSASGRSSTFSRWTRGKATVDPEGVPSVTAEPAPSSSSPAPVAAAAAAAAAAHQPTSASTTSPSSPPDADAGTVYSGPMRVLPYSRQLYEQGVWVSTTRSAVGAAGESSVANNRVRRGVGGTVPGDGALSPFARRFKAARMSLWASDEADRHAGLAESSGSRGGHGLVNTLWDGLVRPTAQVALLPVTAVVRVVSAVGGGGGGSTGGEGATGPNTSAGDRPDGESAERAGPAEPGDSLAPLPVQGLVSISSELFKSTVQGTKHLVNTTRNGLWPSTGPRRASQGGAPEPERPTAPANASVPPPAALPKHAWSLPWRQTSHAPPQTEPPSATLDGAPLPAVSAASEAAELSDRAAPAGLHEEGGVHPESTSATSAFELSTANRAVLHDASTRFWHTLTAPPGLLNTELTLSLAERQEAQNLQHLITHHLVGLCTPAEGSTPIDKGLLQSVSRAFWKPTGEN